MNIILSVISIAGINAVVMCKFIIDYIRKTTVVINKKVYVVYKQRGKLNLVNKGITDLDLINISKLTYLKELNLSNNYITDITPLRKIRKLTKLNINSNNIEDISVLGQHSAYLIELHADNNRIKEIGVLRKF